MINFHIADLVSRLHVASSKYMHSVLVLYNVLNLRLLLLLNIEGIIEGFRVIGEMILVFLKYSFLNIFMLFKNVRLLSSPGKRVFWSLDKLSRKYSYSNFSGVFIISSNKGLITSADALLKYRISGEILLKIVL